MPKTLWSRGRLALIFEPCDVWLGGFYDRKKRVAYVIFIPTLALRYTRKDVVMA